MRRQVGSIIGFVVVGTLLAVLLVGGAYIARRTLSPTSVGVPTPSSEDNSTDDEESDQVADDAATTTDEEAVIPGRADDSEQPLSTPDVVAHDLPETGPADTIMGGILLSGFVAAGAAYKRSRGLLSSL